jgi:hypothetical protein
MSRLHPRLLGIVGAAALLTVVATSLGSGAAHADTPAPIPASSSGATPSAAPTATATPIPKGALCADLHITLPGTVDGLPLTTEKSCTDLSSTPQPAAIDAMALYSLRRSDTLLLATLQVSRFRPQIDVTSAASQAAIIKGLSTTIPAVLRVGDTIVYQTQTSSVTLQIWFRGRYLFVLAIRDLVGKPRTMLRQALAIRP